MLGVVVSLGVPLVMMAVEVRGAVRERERREGGLRIVRDTPPPPVGA